MNQRGHARPEAYYQRLLTAVDLGEAAREQLDRELEEAQLQISELQYDLSEIRLLLYVASPEPSVQGAILALCQDCVGVTEASTSLRYVLSGRARAAERRQQRERLE